MDHYLYDIGLKYCDFGRFFLVYMFRTTFEKKKKKLRMNRYLRTVIVTAAVHWGFGCRLPCDA